MTPAKSPDGGDADRVVVAAVAAVAISAILFASLYVYSYYRSFMLPTLTLLNGAGLAEHYPNQISNGTTVSFELQVLGPRSNTAYGVLVYVSNGTGYTSERSGPSGVEVLALGFPQGEGDPAITVNFSLLFKVSGGVVHAETVIINNHAVSLSLDLPYKVVGLFFQLYVDEGGAQRPVPYAWTSLWLNVEAQ